MKHDQILRTWGDPDKYFQHVDDVKIPSLWPEVQAIGTHVNEGTPLMLNAEDAKAILETWHLCNDLLNHVKRTCKETQTA